jgi:hypothetical protein
MKQISLISAVPSTPTIVQVVPEVAMLGDRMNIIIDHLKWIDKLVYMHSYYSVCSTNEVDDNVMNYHLYLYKDDSL